MAIRCIIVDDEPPAIDELKYILSQIKDVKVIGTANKADEAIEKILSMEPDAVFLDIQMPEQDGFEVAKKCQSLNNLNVIFATAFDQYAVKAFDENAIDYILKPFQAQRIEESIERVRQSLKMHQQGDLCKQLNSMIEVMKTSISVVPKISLEKNGRISLVHSEDIFFFKAQHNEIIAKTNEGSYTVYGKPSLDELESKLSSKGFFRSHRGYLVNLFLVKEIVPWFHGKYLLTTNDKTNTEIPVSRRQVKTLKERLAL